MLVYLASNQQLQHEWGRIATYPRSTYILSRYDALSGLYPQFGNESWAQRTLRDHAGDPREYVYSEADLERGLTHDQLWNAAQHEMVWTGKMHGFMRMYWAKKILEWTATPEDALRISNALNDK